MTESQHNIHSRVAVIGAGLLGTRIAGELALQGCTVHIYDHDPLTVQTIHSTIDDQLQELKDNGLLPPHHQMKGDVIADGLLSSAVVNADVVFEAIYEDAGIKNSIFRDISSLCSSDTILCSSTLTLPLGDVFNGVPSPKRTLGVRFLYPVYLIDSVEMTIWDETADSTTVNVRDFLTAIDKKAFLRQFGDYPKKLSEQEALEKQRQFYWQTSVKKSHHNMHE